MPTWDTRLSGNLLVYRDGCLEGDVGWTASSTVGEVIESAGATCSSGGADRFEGWVVGRMELHLSSCGVRRSFEATLEDTARDHMDVAFRLVLRGLDLLRAVPILRVLCVLFAGLVLLDIASPGAERVMASLQEAQAQLREAAQNLVLSSLDEYGRLGCKMVSDQGQPQRNFDSCDAFVKAAYRKMVLLVHPDKNQGSEKSHLATKALQAIWEKRLSLSQYGGPSNFTGPAGAHASGSAEAPAGSTEGNAGSAGAHASGSAEAPAGSTEGDAGSAGAHASGSAEAPAGSTEGDAGSAAGSAEAPAGSTEASSGSPSEDDFHEGDEGEPTHFPPKQTQPSSLRTRWEPVNVQSLDEALGKDAVRRFTEFSLYEVLWSIRTRVRSIRGRIGWVFVTEQDGDAPPGMRARQYSGVVLPPLVKETAASRKRKAGAKEAGPNEARNELIASLPQQLRQELQQGVPDCLVGKSCFAFPKLVRYIARKDLDVVEVDAVNAYFQHLARGFPASTPLQNYVAHRDEVLGRICQAFGVDRDQAKRLVIALGFGGSLSNWCSETIGYIPEDDDPQVGECFREMQDFEAAMREIHRQVVGAMTPAQKEHLRGRSWGGACFFDYQNAERALLDVMMASAGKDLVSGEHDGVCVMRQAAQRVQEAAQAVSWEVATKPLPSPWEFAAREYPMFDWDVTARMPFRKFHELRGRVINHAVQGESEVRANTADAVRYVAEVLRETVNVPNKPDERTSSYEFFTSQGFWVERHIDCLQKQIQEVLRQIGRHPLAREETRPLKPFNRVDFSHSLGSAVLAQLAERTMPSLDGARINGLLLCSDGYILDFNEGAAQKCRRARPSDRLGFIAKALSKIWQPKNPSGLGRLVRDFLETKAKTLEENEAGQKVIEEFERLLHEEKCEVLSVLKNYAILREKVDGVMTETIDWNWVLWVLRFISRGILGEEHLCELLYLWGGGSSGKDVLNLLIFAVLGLGAENLGVMLPGRYLVAGGHPANENASPLLARMERKRAVWVSEVPHHTHLNEDFVKPFCEQGGAPVPARRLNKAPRDFIPTSVLLATSNHPAQVERKSMTEDNGWDRRLRLLETKVKFTAKKEDLECNEMKADDNLKARVNLGHYNASLLFLVGELYPTLKPRYNEGTELVPKPACMEEAEKEFASKQSGNQFKQFVKDRCVRVEQKIEASKYTDFCKELKLYLGDFMQMVEVRKLAGDNGFVSCSNGSERVVINTDGPWRLKTQEELKAELEAQQARRAAETFFAPQP
ncbi:unnamed protein product [Symbiodinium sp. CCMP2592]|nr:unnamed protein product [Symbiodinium sp. CCMP2592]